MHEIGIASSVLDIVRNELQERPGSRALKIGLRIGALSGVDPEALRFAVEALIKGTGLQSLGLDVEFCPRRQQCSRCTHQFAVKDFALDCPECGETKTTCIGGEEMEIAFLELEQP